jgi:putative MFS transporter
MAGPVGAGHYRLWASVRIGPSPGAFRLSGGFFAGGDPARGRLPPRGQSGTVTVTTVLGENDMAGSATLTPEIIGRAIDRAKLTNSMKFIVAIAAAGYFFDSFDIYILSYALPSIAKEFGLAPQQIGVIGSAGLAGMGVGSWVWGWIADRWGRKMVFAGTVLMFSLCTGITSFAFSAGFIVAARFATGLGLGGMVPIDAALVAEFAPARIRGRVLAALPLLWPMGIFAAAGAGLAIVPTIGWRWLFAIGVFPAILAYVIRRNVPESPRWLTDQGRHEEARESLRYVGVTDEALEAARRDIEASPQPVPVEPAKISDLLTRAYARRMVQTWTMWFFSNFAANSFSVWLPIIYSRYYHIEITRTLQYTFIIAGTSVVGRIFAYSLIDRLGRKALIVLGYGVAACAALSFTQASTETGLLMVAMLYAFFADIGSLAMTVYTPEVFPVRIRGLATSAAMGVGRFGGMTAPLIIGMIIGPTTYYYVWLLMGGAQLLSAGLSLWLARETSGRNLEVAAATA